MKKFVVLTLVLLLAVMTPIAVFADTSSSGSDSAWDGTPITVYATIAVAGEFAKDSEGRLVTGTAIEVTDSDEDGTLTLNDAFTAIHTALCPDGAAAYASFEGQYGLAVGKLWGDESGAFGYYINNISAMSAGDPIADGDVITAYVYSDTVNYSDMYTWFETSESTVTAGETTILTLKGYAYDEAWNLLEVECGDAAITVLAEDGTEADVSASIAENGAVSMTFAEAGTFTVIAKTADTVIVPAYCTVTVEKAEEPDNTPAENNQTDSSSQNADTSDDTSADDKGSTGDGISNIVIWSILGAAIVAVIVFTVVKKKGSK